MALFSFYNVRKPRQFNHKPIYWDPHKEAMEERVRKMKREMGMKQCGKMMGSHCLNITLQNP